MKAKTVAILESRTGSHLAELILRRGGTPLRAPVLEEVPDVDPAAVMALLQGWQHQPFGLAIFQTGVGTRALFGATDELHQTPQWLALLANAKVVVRGPKPIGDLIARGVRIDFRAASPFTTETVLAAIASMPLDEVRVLVQRYGAANQPLQEALLARGAIVQEVSTYQWALPTNLRPIHDLLQVLAQGRADAVVFTSAVQVEHLFKVAQQQGTEPDLAAQINRTCVASIGPVCTRALLRYGIHPTFEANPPKLGPLLLALESALSST